MNNEIFNEYDDEAIVCAAFSIMEKKARYSEAFTHPTMVKQYLQLALGHLDRECFFVCYLNNKNALIKSEILFSGTIDQSAVYPREVARQALLNNASALIISHNHPSGVTKPSQADKEITKKISSVLQTFDIRLLDHIIIGFPNNAYSFAEKGETL